MVRHGKLARKSRTGQRERERKRGGRREGEGEGERRKGGKEKRGGLSGSERCCS